MIVYLSRLNDGIRVWRSLVSRLNGVQEASSSNLDTRTKEAEEALVSSAFFFGELYYQVQHLKNRRSSYRSLV